jgi:hypothetical protein
MEDDDLAGEAGAEGVQGRAVLAPALVFGPVWMDVVDSK